MQVKITVNCEGTLYEYMYEYTEKTLIEDMCQYVIKNIYEKECCDQQNDYYPCKDEIRLLYNNDYRVLVYSVPLYKLIEYLRKTCIDLRWPVGTGKVADRYQGIVYFFHSNENGISPHIHARYSGDEISVDLITMAITGSFKNRKKQREAFNFIKKRKSKYYNDYSELTSGITPKDVYKIDQNYDY